MSTRPPPASFLFAHTESELVAVIRECLRDWHPDDLAQLPEKCRPGKIRDGEDIADLAFTLTTTRIDSSQPNELLVSLETLFAQACQRLSQIESRVPQRESNDVQERQ